VDPDLTPEQRSFQRAVGDFARDVLAPAASARPGLGPVPVEVVRRMGELGLFGIPFPSELGGLDGDLLTFCLCLEEIGREDPAAAQMLAAAVCLAANAVARLGSREQRDRWLAPMARGRIVGAAVRAGEEGSDGMPDVPAVARREEDGWVLEARGAPAANAGVPYASVLVVPARVSPDGGLAVLVVPKDAAGVRVVEHGTEHAVDLLGCRVPRGHELGGRADVLEGCLRVRDEGRIAEAAVAAGAALGAGRSGRDVDALRTLYRRSAWLRDHGRPFRAEAAEAARLADGTRPA
jgi:alkylation response protein AidB-like acyl-CoA dehydrogenase